MAYEIGGLWFEWDQAKSESNLVKHGVDFTDAATVFGDPLARTVHDPNHSTIEDRFVTIGYSIQGRLIIVVHTDRENLIRIISARPASTRERNEYERHE
jgi:hypothetical protein